jgi:hypothetical protein
VFIHFDRWFDTDNAHRALNLLREGKDIKVIYDEPWFWKVSTYRKPVHTNRVVFREQRNTRPYIQQEPDVPEIIPVSVNAPVEEAIVNQEENNYDSSVPLLDYKAAPVPKRTKLIPKKHKLSIVVPDELEDGEIVE